MVQIHLGPQYMNNTIEQLIQEAKHRMIQSTDPAHDIAHASQVAFFARKLAEDSGLNIDQCQAVVLAAWWHDVARTITKNPSFVWMPFLDDIISAFMLWFATIRHGLFGSIAGVATRLIFCKSMGTGAVLTRLLVRKKNRIMINIIKDADNLEVLNYERLMKLMPLVEKSKKYQLGYKTMLHFFVYSKQLQMKTQVARTYVIKMLRAFLDWMNQAKIFAWHAILFGESWCKDMLARGEKLLKKIERRYVAGGLVTSR
jgi:hypothetical protein